MKLNKEKFLKTEFGATLEETITALDFWLREKDMTSQWSDADKYSALQKDIDKLFAQWRVYQLALKQFYGVEYSFTRTDDYFGLCTQDKTDWLIQKPHKN